MSRRHDRGVKAETKLARIRLASGLTQRDLIEATGMSRSLYWRLERGRIANPPLRHLTNCALVLGVPVEALIEGCRVLPSPRRSLRELEIDRDEAPDDPLMA